MKRILIIINFFLIGTFANATDTKPKVMATASMIADIAENIFKEEAEVICIVPVGGDPHLFEPSPKDVMLINDADLILQNGLTFEGWLSEMIENSGTKAETITVTEGVKVISSVDYANAEDPHAWMDAANGVIYAENILKAAINILPNKKEKLEENFNKYKEDLLSLDKYILDKISSIPKEKRILITSHDAFQYYGTKYGLELFATLGTSTDADVKTAEVIALQKAIEESQVGAIFVESTVNPKLIQQLAKDNGIEIGGELFADSLGKKGEKGDSYINMLKHNTDVIAEALTKERTLVNADASETSNSSNLRFILLGLLAFLLIFTITFFIRNRKSSEA